MTAARSVADRPVKQPVVGVGISVTDYAQVEAFCAARVEENRRSREAGAPSGQSCYICVTSVHGIVSAFWNTEFRNVLNRADVATPDGMPVVWALRSFGCDNQRRVYGPTLMLGLCAQAERRGHRVFLYGAGERTLDLLARNLRERFPKLHIAGAISPPFREPTPDEDERFVRKIQESGADIVFVGMSTPKQEYWMSAHLARLRGVVMCGVGAAFDFHAGRVSQAPAWIQDAGFEWLYRLWREPVRLWKRYLLITPQFLPLWALQKAGILRYTPAESRPILELHKEGKIS